MGQGAYILLINNTISDLVKKGENSYQMAHWNWPDLIHKNEAKKVYVEYSENIFKTVSDDGGNVYYYSTDEKLSLDLSSNSIGIGKYNISFTFASTEIANTKVDLGWNHDGIMPIVIYDNKKGSYAAVTNTHKESRKISSDEKLETIKYIGLPGIAWRSDNWMTDNIGILGKKPISKITMPGTHDSGMYCFDHKKSTKFAVTDTTITQECDIYQQLKLGARFFDFRVMINEGGYYLCHGSHIGKLGWQGAVGPSIDLVIEDISRFTSEGHNELIIIKCSNDVNADKGFNRFSPEEWGDLYKKFNQLNHLKNTDEKKSELEPNLFNETLGKLTDSGKNPAIILLLEKHDDGNLSSCNFKKRFPIFDNYSDKDDFDLMSKDQIKKMKDYGSSSEAYRGSGFTASWTLTQSAFDAIVLTIDESLDRFISSIKRLAKSANDNLDILHNEITHSSHPNIILIDCLNLEYSVAVMATTNMCNDFE